MYKKINIVESKYPPTNKNDWWYDLTTDLLKKYKDGSWLPIVEEDSKDYDPFQIDIVYYTTTDGSTIDLSRVGPIMSDSEKVLYQRASSGGLFKDQVKLSTIVLTEGTVTIPIRMFQNCSGLSTVYLPSSLQAIEDEAFSKCTNLYEIHLPKNLDRLGRTVFPIEPTTSLYSVTGKYTVDNTFIVYNNCLYYSTISKLNDDLRTGASNMSLQIPKVAHLGEKALAYLNPAPAELPDEENGFKEGYVGFEIHIPDTVVTIDPACLIGSADAIVKFTGKYSIMEGKALAIEDTFYCFAGCIEGSPTDVYIPDNITVLNPRAFQYCTGIKNVYLPKSISEIGTYCFYGCEQLEAVYCPAIVPPALLQSKDLFPATTTIYVPQESVDTYKKATNWVKIAGQIKGYNF